MNGRRFKALCVFVTNSRFLEFDAVSPGGRVLLHLEIVQTHAELAQDLVPHILQLPQHLLLQLLVPLFDSLGELAAFARVLRERGLQLQNLVVVYASDTPPCSTCQAIVQFLCREIRLRATHVGFQIVRVHLDGTSAALNCFLILLLPISENKK